MDKSIVNYPVSAICLPSPAPAISPEEGGGAPSSPIFEEEVVNLFDGLRTIPFVTTATVVDVLSKTLLTESTGYQVFGFDGNPIWTVKTAAQLKAHAGTKRKMTDVRMSVMVFIEKELLSNPIYNGGTARLKAVYDASMSVNTVGTGIINTYVHPPHLNPAYVDSTNAGYAELATVIRSNQDISPPDDWWDLGVKSMVQICRFLRRCLGPDGLHTFFSFFGSCTAPPQRNTNKFMLALRGPQGAGKSTLLNMVANTLGDYCGRAYNLRSLNARNVDSASERAGKSVMIMDDAPSASANTQANMRDRGMTKADLTSSRVGYRILVSTNENEIMHRDRRVIYVDFHAHVELVHPIDLEWFAQIVEDPDTLSAVYRLSREFSFDTRVFNPAPRHIPFTTFEKFVLRLACSLGDVKLYAYDSVTEFTTALRSFARDLDELLPERDHTLFSRLCKDLAERIPNFYGTSKLNTMSVYMIVFPPVLSFYLQHAFGGSLAAMREYASNLPEITAGRVDCTNNALLQFAESVRAGVPVPESVDVPEC
jgi:hypothetical protein